MITKRLFIILAVAAAVTAGAQPLERDATVYATPDPAAPVVGSLEKGAFPELAASDAPDGWLAVLVPGPHEIYVRNGDIGKNLEIKPGSALYAAPDLSAPVLGRMERGDRAEIKGLRGDWTLYRFDDAVTGFIKRATPLTLVAPSPAPETPRSRADGSARPADAADSPGIPRFFEGRFNTARGFIGFRHPYNFHLLDSRGSRLAYLDVSRLLLANRIETYEDRIVIVYGTVHRLVDSRRKGFVIEVESLHLK